MKSLVATQTSRSPLAGRFPAKLAAVAAAMLALASEAFAAASGTVTLAWNANPETNVAGYRLQYGNSPGVYSNSVDAGNATSATANGLNQGAVYYFVVVAYNSAGQNSPPSPVVTYTVPAAVNTAPNASSFAVTVAEDGQVAATLSGTDAEGDSLGYTVVTAPAKGTLTGTPPNLTYKPASNLNGSDSFTFRVNDGTVNSANATVSINITAVNDVPVANPGSAGTAKNTPVAVVLSGSDVEGSPLTYTVLASPTKGVLGGSAPSLTYTPNTNATGADSFTFRVNDGTANSATATVSISVTSSNATPVAVAGSVTTLEDTNVAVKLAGTDADGNSLTYTVLTQPAKGSLTGAAPNLTYRPNANANGSDSFTFRVNDGTVNSANATVSLTITAVNDVPVANPGSVGTAKNTPVAVVLSGSDVEGSPLTYTVLASPTKGVLSGTAPSLTYTPNTNATGADSFTFRVFDGSSNSAAGTVSIGVTDVNQAPKATSKSVATLKGKQVPIQLSASDADSNPLTYRIVSQPAAGVLTGTPPNLSFRPNFGFAGDTSFTYVANDGILDSTVATVTVKVKPSNRKPVASAMTMVVHWNTASAVVLAGTDADADELSFSLVKQPLHGVLSGTPPNLVYLPNAGFRGKDQFTFVASDGVVKSTSATVSITVINPNNRAPASSSWSVSTPIKTAVPVTLQATDADGDPMVYRIVSKPINGRLSGRIPNLVFKPKLRFVGTTSFTYIANDGELDSAPITVTINVNPPGAVAALGFRMAEPTAITEALPEMSLTTDPARPGIIRLQVIGSAGQSYSLEHSPDLIDWAFDREIVIGEGGGVELEVATPAGARRGFYRLSTP